MTSLETYPRPTKTYRRESYERINPSTTGVASKGKTVLVTGGATGVGLSISQSFAEAGVARIIIVSRSPGPQAEVKKQLEADFPQVKVDTIAAALTDKSRMEQLFNDVQIDILVLNAATSHAFKELVNVPFSDFEDTFNTNTVANLHLTQLYLKSPKPSAKTLINVSSAAIHLFVPHQTGYGPSKAAFTQALTYVAAEHSPDTDGVRIVSFHPGAFFTKAAKDAGLTEGAFQYEDIKLAGDFAVWLTSPEAEFLHGRFVWAEWDVDEIIELKERIKKDPNFLTQGLIM